MDESVVKHLEQPAKLDRPSELLLGAANLIEECGWWQDRPGVESAGSSYCAVLAIREEGDDAQEAYRRLRKVIGVDDLDGIYEWNDSRWRTAQQVVAALRSAAALGA